jgi:hypothetical protein
MRVESSIKQTLFQLKHSNRYDEGEKVAKRCVLKRFHHVIDFLMHNMGLMDISQYANGVYIMLIFETLEKI